jgi:antitoxin (DNA-binding transcriptional repressor) of toxin-antitoxin stability system
MTREITATEAARNFAKILNRVRYAGESFVIVKNGEAMCRIDPAGGARRATVGDLLRLLAASALRDPAFADDVEKAQRKQPKLPRSPWAS